MSRPILKGLRYFPFDSTFFDDLKIRKLIRRGGGDAISVYLALLCFIFKEGYYLNFDEDLSFLVAEKTGLDESDVRDMIRKCVEVGLFDSSLFASKILTSVGIQKRYRQICSQSRRAMVINEFNLLNSGKTPVSSEETPLNSEISTQNKQNENKQDIIIDNNTRASRAREEELDIQLIFFKRNFPHPEDEFRKFKNFNKIRHASTGGWKTMNQESRIAAAEMWRPKDEQGHFIKIQPRFETTFLDVWLDLYQQYQTTGAPAEILSDMLCDKLTLKHVNQGYILIASGRLLRYITKTADISKPIIERFTQSEQFRVRAYDNA